MDIKALESTKHGVVKSVHFWQNFTWYDQCKITLYLETIILTFIFIKFRGHLQPPTEQWLI